MPIELVDPSHTFVVEHSPGVSFTLRHWTMGMQEEVERRCVRVSGKDVQYETGLDRELKIDYSVVAWSGIALAGTDAPCTPENKKKLPVGLAIWLQRVIEERAGLRITEEEKKN